jgi:hypothetical protein
MINEHLKYRGLEIREPNSWGVYKLGPRITFGLPLSPRYINTIEDGN